MPTFYFRTISPGLAERPSQLALPRIDTTTTTSNFCSCYRSLTCFFRPTVISDIALPFQVTFLCAVQTQNKRCVVVVDHVIKRCKTTVMKKSTSRMQLTTALLVVPCDTDPRDHGPPENYRCQFLLAYAGSSRFQPGSVKSGGT